MLALASVSKTIVIYIYFSTILAFCFTGRRVGKLGSTMGFVVVSGGPVDFAARLL